MCGLVSVWYCVCAYICAWHWYRRATIPLVTYSVQVSKTKWTNTSATVNTTTHTHKNRHQQQFLFWLVFVLARVSFKCQLSKRYPISLMHELFLFTIPSLFYCVCFAHLNNRVIFIYWAVELFAFTPFQNSCPLQIHLKQ